MRAIPVIATGVHRVVVASRPCVKPLLGGTGLLARLRVHGVPDFVPRLRAAPGDHVAEIGATLTVERQETIVAGAEEVTRHLLDRDLLPKGVAEARARTVEAEQPERHDAGPAYHRADDRRCADGGVTADLVHYRREDIVHLAGTDHGDRVVGNVRLADSDGGDFAQRHAVLLRPVVR